MWKLIWALEVPNNVCVFIWKLCNNILPTKANLLRKGVVKDATCMFCEREVETGKHVIWQCPTAQDVWGVGPRKIQKCHSLDIEALDFMELLWSKCNKEEIELCVQIAWGIWSRRNSVLHGGLFTHPVQVVHTAERRLQEYKTAQAKEGGTYIDVEEKREIKWQSPSVGIFKANWDVALNNTSKCMGIGVLVRDHLGKINAALCKTVEAYLEPVIAEAMGALRAIELCREMWIQEVIFEGDCKTVVQAINCKEYQWSRYGQVVEDSKTLLGDIRRWEMRHVNRGANTTAHGLAKFAINGPIDRI
ncbi:uncharacterized protein LOC132177154 [Corylus avellana]|uniref:uncharacterized protein LOC132177154 n=1 Tax=Corylus avellana TaxID=13451 RepID=UPI00286B0A3E|nr:uncharacterized protein LOC132177154 [Corylus avellana]